MFYSLHSEVYIKPHVGIVFWLNIRINITSFRREKIEAFDH
jgi:hypothetical protein